MGEHTGQNTGEHTGQNTGQDIGQDIGQNTGQARDWARKEVRIKARPEGKGRSSWGACGETYFLCARNLEVYRVLSINQLARINCCSRPA